MPLTTHSYVYVAARNEEGRQTELARRQHYQQDSNHFGRQEITKCLESTLADSCSKSKGSSSTSSITLSEVMVNGGSPGAGTVIKVDI